MYVVTPSNFVGPNAKLDLERIVTGVSILDMTDLDNRLMKKLSKVLTAKTISEESTVTTLYLDFVTINYPEITKMISDGNIKRIIMEEYSDELCVVEHSAFVDKLCEIFTIDCVMKFNYNGYSDDVDQCSTNKLFKAINNSNIYALGWMNGLVPLGHVIDSDAFLNLMSGKITKFYFHYGLNSETELALLNILINSNITTICISFEYNFDAEEDIARMFKSITGSKIANIKLDLLDSPKWVRYITTICGLIIIDQFNKIKLFNTSIEFDQECNDKIVALLKNNYSITKIGGLENYPDICELLEVNKRGKANGRFYKSKSANIKY